MITSSNNNKPSEEDPAADRLAQCQDYIRPLIEDILRQSTHSGWDEKELLLTIADIAWDLHEVRGGNLT